MIETGCANTESVLAAFRRLGADAAIASSAAEVEEAPHVVLPGVGAFSTGMRALRSMGLIEPLRSRVEKERPLLAICLGHQLLLEGSEEAPGVEGLGIVPGTARRLEVGDGIPLPQIGWNRLAPDQDCKFLDAGWVFFANSYGLRLCDRPKDWCVASAEYGEGFVGAIERGQVLGCQFHPELSGGYGRRLLRTWLAGSGASSEPLATPTIRLVPCLDIKDGRVVKGVKFESLRDAGDPLELASAYELQGADEIVVLDVSATNEGRAHAVATVEELRERLAIPLTVGGGVRGVADARQLLSAGADKIAINSAAIQDPGLLQEMANAFGRQCIVLSIDASRRDDGWTTLVRSGQEDSGVDVVEWAQRGAELGAGEILLTSHDRDGTKRGYDLDLIRAVREACRLPLVASGGAASPQHMLDAIRAGATAVLAASIFHDSEHSVASIKGWLRRRGVEVRP